MPKIYVSAENTTLSEIQYQSSWSLYTKIVNIDERIQRMYFQLDSTFSVTLFLHI